jgi:HlyD family secretion protein
MPTFVKTLLAQRWILIVAAVVIIGGGYFFFFRGNGGAAATLTIVPEDFKQEVSVSGTVVAAEHVDLGFAESGRIAGVYASVGDTVRAGAVLATIENGDLAAAVEQKQAALETEQAKLLSLQNGTRPEQIAIDEAAVTKDEEALRDAITSAYVSADNAVHKSADQFFANPRTSSASLAFSVSNALLKAQVEQERVLLDPALITWGANISDPSFATKAPENASAQAKQYLTQVATFLFDASQALAQAQTLNATYQADITTARTVVASALASLTTAESALAGARGDLALAKAGTTASDIAAQAAEVKAALANVSSAKAALAKTVVVAPFTGIVSKMDVKPGQIVSANTSTISLLSTGAFELETYVPQINISSVLQGDQAIVTLDAYGPKVTFTAKIVSVDPAETVRAGVATYKTVLIFDTTDVRIRSGMTANVVIATGEKQGAIVIPTGAITYEGAHTYVTMASDASKREVAVGQSSSLGRTLILSGLSAGDVILLTP